MVVMVMENLVLLVRCHGDDGAAVGGVVMGMMEPVRVVLVR